MFDKKNSDISIIIPAGGSGERLKNFLNGENKQFSKINDKMILEIVIERLSKIIDFREFIIAFPSFFDENFEIESKKQYFLSKFPFLKIIPGGKTRAESVSFALDASDFCDGKVLVHDAVRPFFHKNSVGF